VLLGRAVDASAKQRNMNKTASHKQASHTHKQTARFYVLQRTLATNRAMKVTTAGSCRNCHSSMTTLSIGTLLDDALSTSCPKTSSTNLYFLEI